MKNITNEDFDNPSLIYKKVRSIYKLMSDLEFDVFGLPIPRHEIYLDVPFSHIENVNKERMNKDDREYLKGKNDIHESNLEYLKLVSKMYNYIFDNYKSKNCKIKCYDENDKMLNQDVIHKKIKDIIFPY
jgi:dTMP kinase